MWKVQAAKLSLVASLGLSTVHYTAKGVTMVEDYAHKKIEVLQNNVVHQVAVSFGYSIPRPERTWETIADEQAELRGVNKCLVRAVIKVESQGGKLLVSSAGALGHMQVMRETARRACDIKTDAERLDPENNIFCGVKVLAMNIKDYGLYKGLQVYNAGPARVNMTKENVEYPQKILTELAKCNA